MFVASFLALQSFIGSASAYTTEAMADQITSLPGAENLDINFNQFSGYLTLPDSSKHMHYWFVESQNDPANDPIAFWTNGGPGCSGLLGFLSEMGPFRPQADLSLKMNQYSWNKVANMVFVEQPCGVGFSYSDNPDDDYKTDDATAASDNYFLIQEWLKRFPEYAANDLYYTSESYGGHYLPTVSKVIVDRNKEGVYPHINYKGFAVGNPATTVQSTTPAMLETFWGHQVVAKPTWDKFTKYCKEPAPKDVNSTLCSALFTDLYIQMGQLNPYAIDYPVCSEDARRVGRSQRYWLMNNIFYDADESVRKTVGLAPVSSTDGYAVVNTEDANLPYEPCEEDFMTDYLNSASVKAALHVNNDVEWVECSRTIRYNQRDGSNSMVPYYQYLIDGDFDLNILVYSGDDDAVCATVGTQSWIWDMGYKVEGRMWQTYKFEEQTVGYFTAFSDTNLGFLTIRGAGHEVPTYKPEVALDMFTRYLNGEWTSARR